MKIRESGMPGEAIWESFFEPDCVLERLGCDSGCSDVVEFGCGYGLFTVAAGKMVSGTVYALDIEPEMVARTAQRSRKAGLSNVRAIERDFVSNGTSLHDNSCDYAMLFNILHLENPVGLLGEARRVLGRGGKAGVIHWNYDPSTPRGPSMAIRPKPDQCLEWLLAAGFSDPLLMDLPCAPYHYGIVAERRF